MGKHIGMINYAKRSALYRDHRMGMSKQVTTCDGRVHYDMTCVVCSCEIRVTPNPAPNQTRYSGTAFAFDCTRRED